MQRRTELIPFYSPFAGRFRPENAKSSEGDTYLRAKSAKSAEGDKFSRRGQVFRGVSGDVSIIGASRGRASVAQDLPFIVPLKSSSQRAAIAVFRQRSIADVCTYV
jgi:hypothetical protein